MFRRFDLDYRTLEAKLDVLKVVVAVGYPAFRLYAFLNGEAAGDIAAVGPWLASPPWDTVAAAGLLIALQFKDIGEFRTDLLPRAEKVAYRHGQRRSRFR